MSVASLPSDEVGLATLDRIRVTGGAALRFRMRDGATVLDRLREADGWRVRFPRSTPPAAPEAVLVNTGGGLAGGDRVAISVALAKGAAATLTSATAERVYRCLGPPTHMDIALALAPGADLALLPQETILYDGAHLSRSIDVTMAPDATLTLADILVLGRRAMPETMTAGALRDRWHIRRDGRLVHAEALRLEGDIEYALQRRAVAGARAVIATVLHVSPDVADRLQAVRAAIETDASVLAAASAWDGKLVVRALGHRADRVRRVIATAARILTSRPTPRVWGT